MPPEPPATDSSNEGLLSVAVGAVCAAAEVCRRVRATMGESDAVSKSDRSPVTVADFASQAVIAAALAQTGLPLVAEEDAAQFRSTAPALQERVLEALRSLRPEATKEDVAQWIDAGGADPAAHDRYWVLDPIDGTKGFLRGGQYAVALALIDMGQVTLGVLGCPQWDAGRLFGATRDGLGAWTAPIEAPHQRQPITVGRRKELCLIESVESGHSNHDASATVASALGITGEPERMDSQAKYAAVGCGDADIYLRLPTRPGYEEKVWDHAAGLIVIEEAGGRVTDVEGKPLDFSLGRTLAANRGVVATSNIDDTLHARVLAAVGEALDG